MGSFLLVRSLCQAGTYKSNAIPDRDQCVECIKKSRAVKNLQSSQRTELLRDPEAGERSSYEDCC